MANATGVRPGRIEILFLDVAGSADERNVLKEYIK
jgi:hypothetical protein